MKKLLLISLTLFGTFTFDYSFAANTKSKVYLTKDIPSFEKYCYEQINKVRQQHGMGPLKMWPQLSDCAREHSLNMAMGKCPCGHEGFDERAKEMRNFAHLSSFGENVAYSFGYKDPVMVAVKGWMESKGHRENILADFEETGIGVSITKDGKFYITQLFSKCR
ncbi:MAG: CAP domain-containing protein [Parachlamydiaceae bacterium]|nr:CAP domain-containing protein [Parachlamydiaceae bacterium]